MYFMDTGKEAELFQLVKHILKGGQTNETDADVIKIGTTSCIKEEKKTLSTPCFSLTMHSVYSSWGRY